MTDNLGDATWENRIAADAQRRDDKRGRLAAAGTALYGPEWISPLARDLDIAVRTAQRWAAGDIEVPDWVFERGLPALLRGPRGERALNELRQRLSVLEQLRGG